MTTLQQLKDADHNLDERKEEYKRVCEEMSSWEADVDNAKYDLQELIEAFNREYTITLIIDDPNEEGNKSGWGSWEKGTRVELVSICDDERWYVTRVDDDMSIISCYHISGLSIKQKHKGTR